MVQVNITKLIDEVQCYQTVRELRWPDGIISYSQNIRTRLSTGGYAPYHRRTSTCLPAPPSRILTGNRDGDDYRGEAMDWKHLLAFITGTVDQELLLRNEYLVTENRILCNQLKGRSRT